MRRRRATSRVRPRSTKLDGFEAYISERLASAAPEWIPASVMLIERRERGYSGGYTMLKQSWPRCDRNRQPSR